MRLDYDGEAKKWLLTVYEDKPPTPEERTNVPGNLPASEALSPIGNPDSTIPPTPAKEPELELAVTGKNTFPFENRIRAIKGVA